MNQHRQIREYFVAMLFGFLTVTIVALGLNLSRLDPGSVLGVGLGYGYGPGFTTGPDNDSLTVTATVEGCFILIRVYPEKRIPIIGNWSNQMEIDIYDANSIFLTSVNLTSNNLGFSPPIDMCTLLGSSPGIGQYILRVKGLSHLRQRFPPVTSFTTVQTLFDLVNLEPPLLAGETSIIFDNFINGLDLATQVDRIYTGDIKNDLNRDGLVNSLDLSNTIFNLYVFGED